MLVTELHLSRKPSERDRFYLSRKEASNRDLRRGRDGGWGGGVHTKHLRCAQHFTGIASLTPNTGRRVASPHLWGDTASRVSQHPAWVRLRQPYGLNEIMYMVCLAQKA